MKQLHTQLWARSTTPATTVHCIIFSGTFFSFLSRSKIPDPWILSLLCCHWQTASVFWCKNLVWTDKKSTTTNYTWDDFNFWLFWILVYFEVSVVFCISDVYLNPFGDGMCVLLARNFSFVVYWWYGLQNLGWNVLQPLSLHDLLQSESKIKLVTGCYATNGEYS